MAPLILELKKRAAEFETVVTVTAQHREMLDQVLAVFEITPDYDLDVMQPNQTITTITTNVMNRLEEVIQAENQILSWSMVIQQRPLLLVWRLLQ